MLKSTGPFTACLLHAYIQCSQFTATPPTPSSVLRYQIVLWVFSTSASLGLKPTRLVWNELNKAVRVKEPAGATKVERRFQTWRKIWGHWTLRWLKVATYMSKNKFLFALCCTDAINCKKLKHGGVAELTNFIDVGVVGQAAVADFCIRWISSGRWFHFHVTAFYVFGGQQGRVLYRGVRVFRAAEGTGTGVVGRTLHQIWMWPTGKQVRHEYQRQTETSGVPPWALPLKEFPMFPLSTP